MKQRQEFTTFFAKKLLNNMKIWYNKNRLTPNP